jgi:hypothetical protein
MRARDFMVQVIFAGGIFLTFVCGLAGVEIGTERLYVIHELGRPTYSVARGETELLTYPAGVHITLTHGRVSEIVGLKPAPAPGPVEEPVAEVPAAKPPPPVVDEINIEGMGKLRMGVDAKAQAKMEKAIEDIESEPASKVVRTPPKFVLKKFLVAFVLRWLLTLIALKLTCKYWGADIFFTGLMTVALADAVVRGIAGVIGTVWLQMPTLFYADEALAAIVMILILRKVSINQSLAQALQITMTTKTFSIVVGSLLVTLALHAIT